LFIGTGKSSKTVTADLPIPKKYTEIKNFKLKIKDKKLIVKEKFGCIKKAIVLRLSGRP